MVLYYLRQRYSALKRLHLMPRWKTLSRVGTLIVTVAIGVLLAFIPRVVRSQPQLVVSNSTPAITVNSLASTPSLLPSPQPTVLHIADSSSDQVIKTDRLTQTERLGNLRIGMTSEQIVQILGNPPTQSPIRSDSCTGDHQDWKYPNQGLVLTLMPDTQDGAQTLERIVAEAPSKLKTKRGIGIGSSWNAVKQAYADVEDTEYSIPGKEFWIGTYKNDDIMSFDFHRQRVIRITLPLEVMDC